MAVGILSLMWLVVVAIFFVKWPHMRADSRTIARAKCYVFDSSRFRNMEGLRVRAKKKKKKKWRGIGESRSRG
jgi:hypothetical protein